MNIMGRDLRRPFVVRTADATSKVVTPSYARCDLIPMRPIGSLMSTTPTPSVVLCASLALHGVMSARLAYYHALSLCGGVFEWLRIKLWMFAPMLLIASGITKYTTDICWGTAIFRPALRAFDYLARATAALIFKPPCVCHATSRRAKMMWRAFIVRRRNTVLFSAPFAIERDEHCDTSVCLRNSGARRSEYGGCQWFMTPLKPIMIIP